MHPHQESILGSRKVKRVANTTGVSRRKAVYTVIPKEGHDKSIWVRIGIAWVNRDDSLNIRLDALPVNGQIHVRDEPEREWRQRQEEAVTEEVKEVGEE